MSGSSVNIRLMKTHDYKKVFDLWKSTPGVGMRSLDDSEEGISKFMKRNPNTCFIAECDNTLAGVILSGHDGRRGYIYHAVVRDEYRGKGIGRLLVQAVEDSMKKEGINRLALTAFAANENGNRFWEHLGYSTRSDILYRNKSINDNNI